MKKKITLLLLLSFTICISQDSKKIDIHIKLDSLENHLNTENDSLVYQYFILKNQKKENKNHFINENGILISKINTKATNDVNQIFLVYSNKKDSNNPILKRSNEITNILNYPNDFINDNLNNILKILKDASNVYIIEKNEIFGYEVLKKVELKMNARL